MLALDFRATRHTAITRGSRVMPVVDLKALARHSKIETTMKYVHTDEQQLRRGVDQLPAICTDGGTRIAVEVACESGSEK